MNETTTTAARPAPPSLEAPDALVSWLRRNRFEIGVGAFTAAVAAFLLVQLTAWPPHEDETLALFVGREPLGGLLDTVLSERGGAPLHFLLAWVVAHAGGGLGSLRLVSAIFAVASVPLVAALSARLAGKGPALVATALVSGSWMLLFHGVYGRMYSLFLFTSVLSYVALLAAVDRGERRAWALWAAAVLACVATHPYGALVLASQGLYVLATRARLRQAVPAFAAVGVAGIPFWLTDLVLAGRFDVGVGGGGEKLADVPSVLRYLERVFGDFTAGYGWLRSIVLLLALAGVVHLARARPKSALLAVLVIGTPTVFLLLARIGSAASPEPRHLIFFLPFFAMAVAAGLVRASLFVGRGAPIAAAAAAVALLAGEIAWGNERTPQLYSGESSVRVAARGEAAAWLAETSRPDDVLFGYEPLYLQAWERGGRVSRLVVPRADAKLAYRTLVEARKPLGRGVWVFDASDTTNYVRKLSIPLRFPEPSEAFEARAWGPFLVVRTAEPTKTVRNYLKLARRAQVLGLRLELVPHGVSLGDPDINLLTVLQASHRLARAQRERADSRSSVSR